MKSTIASSGEKGRSHEIGEGKESFFCKSSPIHERKDRGPTPSDISDRKKKRKKKEGEGDRRLHPRNRPKRSTGGRRRTVTEAVATTGGRGGRKKEKKEGGLGSLILSLNAGAPRGRGMEGLAVVQRSTEPP